MKKVLVTGASGFIGRHTLEKLKNLGYEVYALAFNQPLNSVDVHWHIVDLFDYQQVSKLMGEVQPTHLLHFAWDVSSGYLNSANNFDWVSASSNLFECFQKNGGQRIVVSGTCFQYSHKDGLCNEETTSREPNSIYGECKQSLQIILEDFSKKTGISSSWGNVFFLYGENESPSRLVSSVIISLLKNEFANCTEGTQIRDFLYVEDVADAFVRLLDSDIQGAINIGSGNPVQLKDIINTIANILNKTELVKLGARPMPENEPPQILADITRLSNELNWQPKYSLEEGLLKTIEWWKNHYSIDS